MDALVVRASAKVNLDLRVLGRRADGFHELRTVFQTLALADNLDIAANMFLGRELMMRAPLRFLLDCRRMEQEAGTLHFERAAQYRDQLARLKNVQSQQLMARATARAASRLTSASCTW